MDILKILEVNYSENIYSIIGNDYEGLEWLEDSAKPTKEDLESQWEEVKAKIELQAEAKIQARTSALAKLAALGLTEDEIAAL
jgi:hypothetical protein